MVPVTARRGAAQSVTPGFRLPPHPHRCLSHLEQTCPRGVCPAWDAPPAHCPAVSSSSTLPLRDGSKVVSERVLRPPDLSRAPSRSSPVPGIVPGE